jgi:hypothetical protein
VLVVVDMSFCRVLPAFVAMRTVTVVERSVVVSMAVHGRKVLPAADTFLSVRSVVSYVHMLVLMLYGCMRVCFEPRSRKLRSAASAAYLSS